MDESQYRKLLERVKREIEDEDNRPLGCQFSHILIEHRFDHVIAMIASCLTSNNGRALSLLKGKPSFFPSCTVYVGIAPHDCTIVWSEWDDARIILDLSREFDCKAHWIDVYEDLRMFGYMCYRAGDREKLLIDPEHMFRNMAWSGSDLAGEGPRQYESAEAFLGEIVNEYQPVDTFWSFSRWHNESLRLDGINVHRLSHAIGVHCRYPDSRIDIEFLGEWDSAIRDEVVHLLA